MLRFAAFFVLLTLVGQAPAQMFSHGAPASVLSPTADGRQSGIPAGATSPTPRPFGVNPPLRPPVGVRRPSHRHPTLVPVPVYYPFFGTGLGYSYYPSIADPATDPSVEASGSQAPSDAADQQAPVAASEEAMRMAYLQGAKDALSQERDQASSKPSATAAQDPPPTRKAGGSPRPAEDDSPATVFIFKDGRKIETKSYALMGSTLYDFSGSALRKVELGDLDTPATVKANDDRGITVKLP